MADIERCTLASQLVVLHSCPDVLSSLLKRKTSVLLAAKVLVISRLLHNKLSKRTDAPPYLDSIRSRLASLRRKILIRIDGRCKNLDTSTEGLVEAICAFALATSSSSADALRHFHHIRLQALCAREGPKSDPVGSMLRPVRLYLKTLKDTQAILPVQLSLTLGRIKMKPLLMHQDVNNLIELNLDVHERWLGDDLKAFTPYIRADGLQQSESENLLRKWAKNAFSSLIEDIQSRLGDINDPVDIASSRQAVLELWFSERKNASILDALETLDNMRNVFNDRLLQIIQVQGKHLSKVVAAIDRILQNWQRGYLDSDLLLWDQSMTSMETSHGGNAFRKSLLARTLGRTQPVQEVFDLYLSWRETTEGIEMMIMGMKQTKWDTFDTFGDEDDDLVDNKQILLGEDDPRKLHDELKSVLETAFTSFMRSMEDFSKSLYGDTSGSKAVFLIRLLREIRLQMPTMYSKPDFGLAVVPVLHDLVSNAVSTSPLEECQKRIEKLLESGKRAAGRQLWEGSPELPVICSPWAFRLLQQLMTEMAITGTDIWSLQAMDILKQRLLDKLESHLTPSSERPDLTNGHIRETSHEVTEGLGGIAANSDRIVNGITNGVKSNNPDGAIQRLFDAFYLSKALQTNRQLQKGNRLQRLGLSLGEELHLPQTSMDRMKNGAEEYWKRTSLLFVFFA